MPFASRGIVNVAQNSPKAVLQSLSLVHQCAQHVIPSSMHSNEGPHSLRPTQLSHCTPLPAASQKGMFVVVGTQCSPAPHPGPGFSGSQLVVPLPVELALLDTVVDATLVEAWDVDATLVEAWDVDETVVEACEVDDASVLLSALVTVASLVDACELDFEVVLPAVTPVPPTPVPPDPSRVAPVAHANRVAEARERTTTARFTLKG